MLTTALAGSTRGRTASVWGQIAVTTIASTVGTTIGPPADIEYAVEPVGVLTMMPSAEYCATSSPSTETLMRTTRATPPLWTRGRTASVCGQIAVTTIASTVGTTIGPPADIEYAGEPVGVLTMMRSEERR